MSKLFEPLHIGSLAARNRIMRAATAESLATASGGPTPELARLYRKLAEGGVGTIITGYAFVSPDGKPSEGALGIPDDAALEDFRTLAHTVHGCGAKIVLQLVYGGSKSKLPDDDPRWLRCDGAGTRPDANDASGVLALPNVAIFGPSPVRHPTTRIVPIGAAETDLERIVRAFGDATGRAVACGFDGVEIHAAHGYLLSQFLNRQFNLRDDGYGAGLEGRARLALECVGAARSQAPADFPIFVKLNSCDDLADPDGKAGGLSEDESMQVAAWLLEAGASAIDVSGDWHAASAACPGGAPYFEDFAARLAQRCGAPVIVTGGWRDHAMAEELMARDGIAAIAMARPLICEPDLARRWQSGDASPSRCISCNTCAKAPGLPCRLSGPLEDRR